MPLVSPLFDSKVRGEVLARIPGPANFLSKIDDNYSDRIHT